MKKTLGIAATLIIIATIGLVSYYYFVFDKVDPETGRDISFLEFLPFGSSGDAGPGGAQPGDGNEGGEDNPGIAVRDPSLGFLSFVKISEAPVAGAVAFDAAAGTYVRYIEKATGHIYQFETATGKNERISNTTIPKIREALWHPSGNSVITKYLKNDTDVIEHYHLTVRNATSSDGFREVDGVFLLPNISEITFLASADKLFYLLKGGSGSAGFVSTPQAPGPQIFKSAIRDWNAKQVTGDIVSLETKPGSYAPGYLYQFNTQTKAFSYTLGPVQGLTSLISPTGNYVLYSENSNGFDLKVKDLRSGETRKLAINGLAEKCVWSKTKPLAYCASPRTRPNADYLELWYGGLVFSSDTLWIIDASTGAVDILHEPYDTKSGDIDGTNLSLNGKEDKLILINKRDSMLWMLDLASPEAATGTPSA